MKTFFATALISSALAVGIESNRIVRQDDSLSGYAISPYDKGTDYLRGNFPGGARKLGYRFSKSELKQVYPTREYVGFGPGGLGYNADGGNYVNIYGTEVGRGAYLAGTRRLYGALNQRARYPIPEAYETSSDSESHSFGSDSFSQSGSFSDSDDGQHDSDSGSQYDSAENDTAFKQGGYGFPRTVIASASEASSLSDYSLSERFDSTDSNPETDGSADTTHCHYVNGMYTCHRHTNYQRGHLGLITGDRKESRFDFSKYTATTAPVLTHKDEGFDGSGAGPWTLTSRGNIYQDPTFSL